MLTLLKNETVKSKRLAEAIIIDEVQELGASLENIGSRYHYEPLITLGKDLVHYVEECDVDSIEKTLQFFQQIIPFLEKFTN